MANGPFNNDFLEVAMGFFRVIYAVSRVSIGAGTALIKGVGSTAIDACNIVDKLVHKDFEGSLDVLGNRIERTANGIGVACQNTLDILEDLDAGEKPFLREENIQRLTNITSLGLAATVGLNILDSDESSNSVVNFSDDNSLFLSDSLIAETYGISENSIDNGVFVGNENDLQALIQAGESSNTEHIASDEITRNLEARDEFLATFGYDSVPSGYEVHHIVPLSEGGSDTPDNMILVDEDTHDKITTAHRAFYGWGEC